MIAVESTGDVSLDGLRELFAEPPFDDIVEIDERQYFVKSTVPPSWVQFLISVDAWQAVLATGVSAALAGYAAAAGKAAWKQTEMLPKGLVAGSKVLARLAQKILRLRESSPPEFEIAVGVPIGDGSYSALLKLTGGTAEEIEAQLVSLAVHSPR